MINEFIEKIIVHAPERIDGDRVQEVEIHLRFIGQFELPAPELTEEEIKRQEQLLSLIHICFPCASRYVLPARISGRKPRSGKWRA